MEILQGEGTSSGGSNDAPVAAAPEKACRRALQLPVIFIFTCVISVSVLLQYAYLSQNSASTVAEASNSTKLPKEARVCRQPSSRNFYRNPQTGRVENLHIAMMGDSLTRYQYLSLVNFLENDTWNTTIVQDGVTRDFVNLQTFRDDWPGPTERDTRWIKFFEITANQVFKGKESCDCYRINAKEYLTAVREVRYYANNETNNFVSFFPRWGNRGTRGMFSPHDVLQQQGNQSYLNKEVDPSKFRWNYNWTSIIRNYISNMEPKPQYFLFNSGIWGNQYLTKPILLAIREALLEHQIVGIYKTTTRKKDQRGVKALAWYELFACELFPCLGTQWTADLNQNDYWDNLHFYGRVYRRMNLQLFGLLEILTSLN